VGNLGKKIHANLPMFTLMHTGFLTFQGGAFTRRKD
jgi:hypothetical protein